MLEFIKETLTLLPFLFATYLVLEAVEAHAGSKLGGFLERAKSVGPLAGGLAGAIPQCGVSAAAASFYAGGVVTVGTLLAVFLSTSDELIPVSVSVPDASWALVSRIVGIKIACAIGVGFTATGILVFLRHLRREVHVHDLCEHSHCRCEHHKGIVVPALIHTAEIFLFIFVFSGAIELAMHYFGEDALDSLRLNRPLIGEAVAGLVGLVPNCAVSVASAKLYLSGAMSAGALMASSFTGTGLGLLVLFRTNRSLKENLAILVTVYLVGTLLGWLTGPLLPALTAAQAAG